MRYVLMALLAYGLWVGLTAPGPPVPSTNPHTVDITAQYDDEIDNSQ